MSYKSVFKEIMREYDRDRSRARQLLEKRQAEVYERIPRIREIDEEVNNTGFRIAKEILHGDSQKSETDIAALVENLKSINDKLITEKNKLMDEYKYPAGYFTDIYQCGICKDTGYVSVGSGEDGLIPQERCSCMKQRLINKYYGLSSISDVLERENFDTFDLRYYSEQVNQAAGLSPRTAIQTIYRVCMDFITNFDSEFCNLLFYGDNGLGKTFLCNCIAKDILDMGKTVLYVTAPQLFKMIEDYRFNREDMEEPDESIDAITEVDLLIIDDLGTEFATIVTSSELFNIINSRLLTRKHTVISTNLSPADFENQYSERLTSRFFGNYRLLKFFGEDIRMKKKYRGKV